MRLTKKIMNKNKNSLKTRKNYNNENTNHFLSSCIQYYQQNIFTNHHSLKKQYFANIFLEKGPIFVIDYPNIIHILHETYKERNKLLHKECLMLKQDNETI